MAAAKSSSSSSKASSAMLPPANVRDTRSPAAAISDNVLGAVVPVIGEPLDAVKPPPVLYKSTPAAAMLNQSSVVKVSPASPAASPATDAKTTSDAPPVKAARDALTTGGKDERMLLSLGTAIVE